MFKHLIQSFSTVISRFPHRHFVSGIICISTVQTAQPHYYISAFISHPHKHTDAKQCSTVISAMKIVCNKDGNVRAHSITNSVYFVVMFNTKLPLGNVSF